MKLKKLAIAFLMLFALPSFVYAGPDLSKGWHIHSGHNIDRDILLCGCTPIAIAASATTGVHEIAVLCKGGSGGGGSSGPPTLTEMTQADFEDLIRRTFTQDGVKVKVEDLQGQVSQAVLDALNQGVTYQ